jgi:hypothetical protein
MPISSHLGADSKATRPDRSKPVPANAGRSAQRAYHQELTDSARERHDELTAAIERLERALAEAGVHRERSWSERATPALDHVRHMIQAHADGVEESGGLLDEIQAVAPRLAKRVEAVRHEHASLKSRAAALADSMIYREGLDVLELRSQAAGLLVDLRQHRAVEADLTYEAFWMELGAVD